MQARNVIFDYGSVLVGWRPGRLLDRIFPDGDERSAFEQVLNRDFIPLVDISRDLGGFVEEFSAMYPWWAHAASMYRQDWTEMLGEDLEGMAGLVRDLRVAGFGVYGLTNWNRETFDRSREISPAMRLIPERDLVVSGDLGIGKPDPAIYRYALKKFGLAPGDCVFVDDKSINVAAAIRCGLRGVVFKGADDLRVQLRRHGLNI